MSTWRHIKNLAGGHLSQEAVPSPSPPLPGALTLQDRSWRHLGVPNATLRGVLSAAITLVLGAILGVAATEGWHALRERGTAARLRRARRQRQLREMSLASQTISTYSHHKKSHLLYSPRALPVKRIAILASDYLLDRGVDLRIISEDRRTLPVDSLAIERLRSSGARVWDGDILYLISHKLGSPSEPIQLYSGVANYFSAVSRSAEWRTEILSTRPLPSTRKSCPSLEEMLLQAPPPLAISGAAACLFWDGKEPRIPVIERSFDVVNDGGVLCTIPTFGMESNVVNGSESAHSAIMFNFLKEFMEEVFGGEESLDHTADGSNLDPDTVFEGPHGQELLEQFASGRAWMRTLGLGGQLTDGGLVVPMVAVFQDPDFYSYVKKYAVSNFEGAMIGNSKRRIAFTSIPSLMAKVRDAGMAPSSAFALDLAISTFVSSDGRIKNPPSQL